MKKLITILSLFLIISPVFSQHRIDDAQMFGSARGLTFNHFEFGNVTQDIVVHEFIITNNELIDITITSANLPQGMSIMIPKKVIEPKENGKIIVSVYKEYVDLLENENTFDEKFSISVRYVLPTGIIIDKTYIYQLSGQFE